MASGQVLVGKHSFVSAATGPFPAVALSSCELAVYVAVDEVYVEALVLRDELRADANQTLRRPDSFGVRDAMVLTGDAKATAGHVAAEIGIADVRAECSPEDKVRAVQDHRVGPVMMVGDGVNDAPLLAAADVGVAMGARGATAVSESADDVVMTDDLSKVADDVAIGHRTMSVAVQSIWLGIGLSLVLMVVAAFGFIPAIVGAVTQEVVDLVSIISALRARRARRHDPSRRRTEPTFQPTAP